MAHFQERRTGKDRRQDNSGDRRKNPNRRSDSDSNNIECLNQARYKAWLVMTDKNMENP